MMRGCDAPSSELGNDFRTTDLNWADERVDVLAVLEPTTMP